MAILAYDLAITCDPDRSRLEIAAGCAIRNQGFDPVRVLTFDLLAREEFYGVKVDVRRIAAVSASGPPRLLEFAHATREKPGHPASGGTAEAPKIIRVHLAESLMPGREIKLEFGYSITAVDADNTELPYRLIAKLPNGRKEVCLIADFSWYPRLHDDSGLATELAGRRNFFVRQTKPSWTLRVSHPAGYEALALDGQFISSRDSGASNETEWRSVIDGACQVFIGWSDRIAIDGDHIAAVFLLPRGDYDRALVEDMGRFLIRAYEFYSNLWIPLTGKDIHIAVSSSNMGGHGAFLGSVLDRFAFSPASVEKALPSSPFFHETAAHELAHSWWGGSLTAYGRGTKFLLEGFSNFSAWHLARQIYGKDLFKENLAVLFFRKMAGNRLFLPEGDDQRLAYTKGALVLDILRREMGDEGFFRSINRLLQRSQNGHATFIDFVSVCQDVSDRDWIPFFHQWCYEEGYPKYRVTDFRSSPKSSVWETRLVVRNEGQGAIQCPLELQMEGQVQREQFSVNGGEEKVLVYLTPSQVMDIIIDPDHGTYQGDDRKSLLRLTSLGESTMEWVNYWRGIAFGELQDYASTIQCVSMAIGQHERAFGSGKANPVFYFSRAIARSHSGDAEGANRDIGFFFDQLIDWGARRNLDGIASGFAYAGLISGDPEEQLVQLGKIVAALTGEDIPLGHGLSELSRWWRDHRPVFKISPHASILSPGGLKREER